MSLKQIDQKIKSFSRIGDIFLGWLCPALIIALIWGLTIVRGIFLDRRPINIKYGDFEANFAFLEPGYIENRGESDGPLQNLGPIGASKNGTKYYWTTCSGFNRIKEENRVFFDSEEAAKGAGYELAKNCQKP